MKKKKYALECKNLNLWYGENQALYDVSMNVIKNKVTALIGPSGCGKSTLIRCFNRMNDTIDECKVQAELKFNNENIYSPNADVVKIRRKIGMVFQKPNPFPKSIYENIAYGPRTHGERNKEKLEKIVKKSLKAAALWDEVKDRLQNSAMGLSGGQQQRLCIARALAVEPDILLMDEPCSALDPIATTKIEDLIDELKKDYTVVIVTHNMQQAARISDYTGFMYLGKLIEFGETRKIFENPDEELKQLKSEVLDMANLSREMLNESIEALKTSDVTLAEKVIIQRKDIREYDYKIEDDAKRLIALYQPVAKDLRTIITILKMNTYLTRIGIYSKDISRDVKAIPSDNGFPRLKSICLMGDLVLDMLDDVIKAYETEDLSFVEDMGKRDDTIDDLFFTILRECISFMVENPKTIGFYTHYMLIARYLERCGDHVCKISEKLNYMITGQRLIIK